MIIQRLEDVTETSGKLHEVSAASAVCWHPQIQLPQRQVNGNLSAMASGTAWCRCSMASVSQPGTEARVTYYLWTINSDHTCMLQ